MKRQRSKITFEQALKHFSNSSIKKNRDNEYFILNSGIELEVECELDWSGCYYEGDTPSVGNPQWYIWS